MQFPLILYDFFPPQPTCFAVFKAANATLHILFWIYKLCMNLCCSFSGSVHSGELFVCVCQKNHMPRMLVCIFWRHLLRQETLQVAGSSDSWPTSFCRRLITVSTWTYVSMHALNLMPMYFSAWCGRSGLGEEKNSPACQAGLRSILMLLGCSSVKIQNASTFSQAPFKKWTTIDCW